VFAQDPNASSGLPIVEKELEVAMGIDAMEKVEFDYNPKMVIGAENLLKLLLVPTKREIIFRGLKPGRTTVTIRDNLGDVRLRYTVIITATGKSNVVAELRELIGDVEGLDIGIKGGKVFIGGEIVVPDDIGRVSKVLASYPEVLTLIELSPQTQRIIARKMSDELARNNLKDVSVRIVNKTYWLEGVVNTFKKKDLAMIIATAYLPPKIASLAATGETRYAGTDSDQIINFIGVDEKKDPLPAPKMVKVTAQFVELAKNYGKVFAFKWAPLMGEDGSSISFGQTQSGNVTSTSKGTLSAAISGLFPKLNAAKSAGYARVIQSGMIITKDGETKASITKNTSTPFAVGTGDFSKATASNVGLNMDVQAKVLEQEKIELALNFSVSLTVGNDAKVTTSNTISTNLVIKSKESAAIGGIVQNQSSTEYDKTDPAPSNATAGATTATPLFRLLRSKNYSTTKTQYVMFVSPEIIESASVGTEEIRKKFRRRE
jgi:pilus assembly protein CpaC